MRLFPALLVLVLAGCMLIDHVAPQNRLADQVHQFNDEVRWGRIDLAARRVDPAHRSHFLARHRAWGRDIRVADADVTNLELGLPEGRAASLVTYSWIDERTMTLRATSVRQIWRGEGEGFVLVGEEIVGGEPDLLAGAPIAAGSAGEEAGAAITGAGGETHVARPPPPSSVEASLFED
jgi:hypothetical protein